MFSPLKRRPTMFSPIKRSVARQFVKGICKSESKVSKQASSCDFNDSYTSHTSASSSDDSMSPHAITECREHDVFNLKSLSNDLPDMVRDEDLGMKNLKTCLKQNGSPRRESIFYRAEIEVVCESGKTIRRKTCVSFNEIVKTKRVTKLSSLEKPKVLWFQEKEYRKIRKTCLKLADMAEVGSIEEGNNVSLRGLELMAVRRSEEIRNRRDKAWDAVIDEQDAQIERCTFDEQAVADSYRLVTVLCWIEAAKRAKQDEKDVESYLKSTREMCNRWSTPPSNC